MSNSNILHLTRQALFSYLLPNCGGANLYDEKSSAEMVAPCVIVMASNASEDPPLVGNFWVDAEVEVRTVAAVDSGGTDPKPDSDALATTVYEALEVTDLASQLSSQGVANYTVMGFAQDKSFEQGQDGDCWLTRWRRRLYCARF